MRTFVVKKHSDLQSLGNELLVSGLAASRSRSVLESLRSLNPHLDLESLAPGAVLLVPDAASFRPSASKSVESEKLEALQALVRQGFDAAGVKLKGGGEKRATERKEVSAVLNTARIRRATEADPQVKKQIAAAAIAAKKEEQDDAQAQKTLDAAAKAIQAELAALSKLLG